MNQEATRKDWNERGFSFGIFRDPPGQVWADFVHRTDELVMLAEGEIELEIEGKTQRPLIGQEIFIPANAIFPRKPWIKTQCHMENITEVLQFPNHPTVSCCSYKIHCL